VGSIPRWFWFVLIIVGYVVFDQLRARKRRKALAELADRLGLIFYRADWGPRWPAPSLESRHFARTRSQSFRNALSGEGGGFRLSFFDHVISGKGGHTDTIASFTQSTFLPTFSLEVGGFLTEIADVAIRYRIKFSADSAFSDRFRLIGPDEDRVRQLFTADMRAFLITLDPKWRIEASGYTFLIYRPRHSVKPEDYRDFIDETTQIAQNFFNHCCLEKPAF
jgi:hypothetical protein